MVQVALKGLFLISTVRPAMLFLHKVEFSMYLASIMEATTLKLVVGRGFVQSDAITALHANTS